MEEKGDADNRGVARIGVVVLAAGEVPVLMVSQDHQHRSLAPIDVRAAGHHQGFIFEDVHVAFPKRGKEGKSPW